MVDLHEFPIPCAAVVPDADAAAVVALRMSAGDRPLVQVASAGWWSVTGKIPGTTELLDVLADVPRGLVVWGTGEIGQLVAVEEGHAPLELLFGSSWPSGQGQPRAEKNEAFLAWSRRNAPQPLTARRAAAFWRSLDGGKEPAGEAVLTSLGWKVVTYSWQLLPGCKAFMPGDGAYVGEVRVVWEQVRWLAGQGDDFYGLWDQHTGELALRTPLTTEGLEAIKAEQRRLVIVPILEQSTLPASRWWAPLRDWVNADAVLVTYQPERLRCVVYLNEHLPRTFGLHDGPVLGEYSKDWFRKDALNRTESGNVLLTGEEEALSLGAAQVFGRAELPWRPVPEEVPRRLLTTAEWVREAASAG